MAAREARWRFYPARCCSVLLCAAVYGILHRWSQESVGPFMLQERWSRSYPGEAPFEKTLGLPMISLHCWVHHASKGIHTIQQQQQALESPQASSSGTRAERLGMSNIQSTERSTTAYCTRFIINYSTVNAWSSRKYPWKLCDSLLKRACQSEIRPLNVACQYLLETRQPTTSWPPWSLKW